jgi:hypothetical protein
MGGKRKGPRCALYAPKLSEADLASVRAALGAPEVTGSSIFRWLEQRGVSICVETIKRHRRRECYCRREIE